MPRRWLSTRGRNEFDTVKNPHHEFDFAFSEPSALVDCRETQNVEVLRPTTSAGSRDRSRSKPDLTLLIERPRSSDSVYPKTPQSARLDASKIGLAFGSPRHPPQEFASMAAVVGPQLRQLACCDEDTAPLSSKARKWKLNPFSKQRAEVQKDIPCQVRVQSPDASKLGLPIQRTPWRNPKSPLIAQTYSVNGAPPPPPEKDKPSDHYQARCTIRPDGVPAVEINIPETPLDRVSIMFKDVDGFGRPRLLARRSRELESLMLAGTTKSRREDLEVPQLQRRVTSPTIRSKQEFLPGTSSNANLQKYSLFPATPINSRSPSNSVSSQACRSQVVKPPISAVAFAENLDRPSAPFAASDSRASSTSEIFFDIKSFRDSSGQIGHQFEMMRAPPAAVQLIRSQSKRLQMSESTIDDETTKLKIFTPNQSTAEQIDETIEIVERLTSPASTPPRATPTSIQILQDKHRPVQPPPSMKKVNRKRSLTSRVGSLSLGVPSPVPEAAEEEASLTGEILRSEHYATKESSNQRPVPPEAIRSPERSLSPLRPATIKNVHNIPLSKYAPRRVAEDLVKQTGLRPVRLGRANTDNSIFYDPRASISPQPGKQSRSSTLPIPSRNPRPNYHTDQDPETVSDPRAGHWQDVPVKITYVNPTAEVSVARTISLSRRPSTKVTVARHPSRTESKTRPEQVTEKSVSLGIAVVQEVDRKHKHGQSIGVILETATIAPSNPPPSIPSPQLFEASIPSSQGSQAGVV